MERCWDGRTQRRCLRFSQAVVIASVCASLAAWTLAPVDVDFLKAAAASGTSQLTLAELALRNPAVPISRCLLIKWSPTTKGKIAT